MKVRITIHGAGGKQDRPDKQTIETGRSVSESIFEALKAWELDAGDTIKIVEVE